MGRDIRRRLAAIEARQQFGKRRFILWINEGDGLLRNSAGEVMTREAFDAAYPNSKRFTLDIFGERIGATR